MKIITLLKIVHQLNFEVKEELHHPTPNHASIGMMQNKSDSAWKLAKMKAHKLGLAISAQLINETRSTPFGVSMTRQRYEVVDMRGKVLQYVDAL
jgi:hypothetical protein